MVTQAPEDRVVLAGEYVLGTLDASERRQAELLLKSEESFRNEVYFWERRFSLLGLRLKPVEPRTLVWLAIRRRIDAALPVARHRRNSRLVTTWAWLATAASALLAVALVMELNRPLPPPQVVTERVEVPVPTASLVAVLQLEDKTVQWTVSASPDQRRIKVRAMGTAPASLATHDTELWLIGDAGPVSLGVIPQSGEAERELPSTIHLASGKVLAISAEPHGGSPTGQPTGPVISTATIMQAG